MQERLQMLGARVGRAGQRKVSEIDPLATGAPVLEGGDRLVWRGASAWARAYVSSTWELACARLGEWDAPVPGLDARFEAQLAILGARLSQTSTPQPVWESIDRVVCAWWGLSCEERARLSRLALDPWDDGPGGGFPD